MLDWHIEKMTRDHDVADFACGQPSLDDFLRRYASQYDRRDFARTYVAVLPPSAKVLGYYTLSSGAVDLSALPDEVRKKLPRHPVPVARLGRLAVDGTAKGQGLGETLLLDALRRCEELSAQLAQYAVEVDAIDEHAKAFYVRYGFAPLLDDPLHLYLSMKAIRALDLLE